MIMMSTCTALLLNHKTRSAELVTFDGSLEKMYELLGCDCIDLVRLDENHVMFVDDEGLYKDYDCGFSVALGNRKPADIVGSALITGEKTDGECDGINFDLRDINIEVILYGPKTEKEKDI